MEELREIKVSKQRKTVVINSLHDMAMQNDTEEIREAIIELVEREDVWLILSGRCAVPPWLTAVRYREVFYVIGEQELLFDEDQADQYIAMSGDEVFTIQARRCKRCGRLLTSQEAVERGYGCQCAMKAKKEEEAQKPIPGQRTIFDYLEDEEE